MLQPRTLKGFRDYLPETMIPRERLIEVAKSVYRSYGFSPIDTPALEYREILEGKAGEESNKQLYKFIDHGGREVALRFDLTVPLARFVAQHVNTLGTPFKRYHIAPVWRGENTQRGRYREFMQCDFDTIGTTSVVSDIETALVIHDLFHAIGFREFKIHINNRMILNGLLEKLELADQAVLILRALDKLAKIGRDKVGQAIVEATGTSHQKVEQILQFAELSGTNDEILNNLEPLLQGSDNGATGLARLRELMSGIRHAGVPEDCICLDVSIARGLDYYTGAIFETFLSDMPDIGSVCSGGRYDNLAGLYTKQTLPGIGASLGLDRLLAAMEELEMIEKIRTPAEVFIPYFDPGRLGDYLRIAACLRAADIGVEVFPDTKKLGQQLKYADQRGFQIALIAGGDEFSANLCQIKHLPTKSTQEVSLENNATAVIEAVRHLLERD